MHRIKTTGGELNSFRPISCREGTNMERNKTSG